jgi:hypothetical protein
MQLNVLLRGQSNAELFWQNGGLSSVQSQVEKLLGFDGTTNKVNVLVSDQGPGGANTVDGGTAFLGDWMTNQNGTWVPGNLENGLLSYIDGLSADVKAAPTAVVWIHSEYDSANPSLTTAGWTQAVQTDAADVRSALGQSATTTPYVFVSGLPYGTGEIDSSGQAIKQGMANLAADPSFNGVIGAQANDLNMDAYNPTPGGPHMDAQDGAVLAPRIAAAVAEQYRQYAQPGSPMALGQVDSHGPEVLAAGPVAGNPDQMLLTIAADQTSGAGGIGLNGQISATAASGVGWDVHRGDTVLHATGATVTDATHVVLSFADPVSYDGQSQLYYTYGYGRLAASNDAMGNGNAIYDQQGMPIFAPPSGVAVGAPPVPATNTDTTTAPITPAVASAPPAFVPPAASPTPAGMGGTLGDASASTSQTLQSAPGVSTLAGGQGPDAFLVDPSVVANQTLLNFNGGDIVAILGVDASKAALSWSDSTDAQGRAGAVLSIAQGGATSSVTFAGLTADQVQHDLMTSGTNLGRPDVAVFG